MLYRPGVSIVNLISEASSLESLLLAIIRPELLGLSVVTEMVRVPYRSSLHFLPMYQSTLVHQASMHHSVHMCRHHKEWSPATVQVKTS